MVDHAPPETSPSPNLLRRIEEARQKRAQLLAEGFDPQRELGILLREFIGHEALQEAYREYLREKNILPDPDDESADDD